MDITGTAMSSAMADFKYLMGLQNLSDPEELAENDEEYKKLSEVTGSHVNRRKNSDQSVSTQYKKNRDDIYQVRKLPTPNIEITPKTMRESLYLFFLRILFSIGA